MEAIILLGGVQALFFVLLLIYKKGKICADWVLIILLLTISAHLLIYFAYIQKTHESIQYVILFMVPGPSFTYLYGPFLLIYTILLTSNKPVFKKSYNWHFAPFILYNLILFLVFIFKGNGDLSYLVNNPFLPAPFYYFFQTIMFLSGLVYTIWTLIKLKNHKENIREYFSYTDKINLNWLKILTGGLLSIWILLVIGFILINYFKGSVGFKDDFAVFVFVVIYVFVLGFYGFRQGGVFVNEQIKSEPFGSKFTDIRFNVPSEKLKDRKSVYKKSGLKEETAKLYIEKLQKSMEEERLFLDPSLDLNQLSSILEISTHHLTEILNLHIGKNFFNYINEYRVAEVKRKISDENFKHLSLLGVALESGFNSKSSFNRIFKQQTGQTPSHYLKIQRSL